jgi:hypothetical protein
MASTSIMSLVQLQCHHVISATIGNNGIDFVAPVYYNITVDALGATAPKYVAMMTL